MTLLPHDFAGCFARPAPRDAALPYARRSVWAWVSAASLLGLCSCSATAPHQAARPSRPAGFAAAQSAAPGVSRLASAATRGPGSRGNIQTVGYETPVSCPPLGGPHMMPLCPPGQPGAAPVGPGPQNAIQWCPADDRVAVSGVDISGVQSQEVLARDYPDEYLYDGGDRRYVAMYEMRDGLDTEDAVAEYTDRDGNHVRPTNRVAIYSPRFAAVTAVNGPSEGINVHRLADAEIVARGVDLRGNTATIWHEQREGTQRLVTRLRGSSFKGDMGQKLVQLDLGGRVHEQVLRTFAMYTFLRDGQLIASEGAEFEKFVQSAVTWTRDQNPVVAASTTAANEVRASFDVNELKGVKIREKKQGPLRVVKLADKKTAQQGEIVTFTIRIDNLGEDEMRNVVILDNLTERLEYVVDSATCDQNGRLVTEDNDEGSLILRWELTDPLRAMHGAVVTFQARVR